MGSLDVGSNESSGGDLLNGPWPLIEQEQVVVLTDDGFFIATVEKCNDVSVDVRFLKPVLRGKQEKTVWMMDPTADIISTPKESVLSVRTWNLEKCGSSRKNIQFNLSNFDLIMKLTSQT